MSLQKSVNKITVCYFLSQWENNDSSGTTAAEGETATKENEILVAEEEEVVLTRNNNAKIIGTKTVTLANKITKLPNTEVTEDITITKGNILPNRHLQLLLLIHPRLLLQSSLLRLCHQRLIH